MWKEFFSGNTQYITPNDFLNPFLFEENLLGIFYYLKSFEIALFIRIHLIFPTDESIVAKPSYFKHVLFMFFFFRYLDKNRIKLIPNPDVFTPVSNLLKL